LVARLLALLRFLLIWWGLDGLLPSYAKAEYVAGVAVEMVPIPISIHPPIGAGGVRSGAFPVVDSSTENGCHDFEASYGLEFSK
jgi:hypothetical protein